MGMYGLGEGSIQAEVELFTVFYLDFRGNLGKLSICSSKRYIPREKPSEGDA